MNAFSSPLTVIRVATAALCLCTACSSGNENTGLGDDTVDGGTTNRGGATDSGAAADARNDASRDAGSSARPDAAPPTEHFSFFVTSLAALQELSGSQQGFGGDLRFGETGAGAGLRGADKICATIAEKSMTGAGRKTWRAFLSATSDENGAQVNAIDRIGNGPWYDRLGRLFAQKKADLLADRPTTADSAIANDFPNEDGVPNHQPDPTQDEVDNHDMLTGTNEEGKLYSANATCKDWTSNTGDTSTEGKPRVGHSWPRSMGGDFGGFGGPGGFGSMNNWMSALDEAGCKAGVNLLEQGGPDDSVPTVGSGGGYGGFYCFALTP